MDVIDPLNYGAVLLRIPDVGQAPRGLAVDSAIEKGQLSAYLLQLDDSETSVPIRRIPRTVRPLLPAAFQSRGA